MKTCCAGRATLLISLLFFTIPAFAAAPHLNGVRPTGGQRGTDVVVTLHGSTLKDFQGLLLYDPGITVLKVESAAEQEAKVTLRIAPDCAIGEHRLRGRTATGLTELRTFWVGALPTVTAKEIKEGTPAEFTKAQPIPMNVTVDGVIHNEEVDYFRVDAKKGQRITAEVEGLRLAAGGSVFDPFVAILDQRRFELGADDDSVLLKQDPTLSVIAPADGPYFVMVRETTYGGSNEDRYRLHIGDLPRPTAVFPCGGQPGEKLAVRFLGDKSGPIAATLQLPAQPEERWPVLATQDGHMAPSPNWVRVQPIPNVLKEGASNSRQHATVSKIAPPLAFNGILEKPGEYDWFRFHALKGQTFNFHVWARHLRMPLDSVLSLHDSEGKTIIQNDDSEKSPDSYFRQTIPADGDYYLEIHDHLHRGGDDYVYRIEITLPGAAIALHIPEQVINDSQARQWVTVPRGNRFLALIQAQREDLGGDVTLSCTDLPAGVTMQAPVLRNGQTQVPVLFSAAANAPLGGSLADLQAQGKSGPQAIIGHFSQEARLVQGNNAVAFYTARVDRLAVAATEEAPFDVQLVEPTVPLLQSGQMNLKIVAHRKPGFDAPITIEMPYHPPGVGADAAVIMEKGKSEVAYPINASADAALGDWPLAVSAHADIGGQIDTASTIVKLTVVPPLETGEIPIAATDQGRPVEVICKLHGQTPFEGAATLTLIGLPDKCQAAPVQINKDANEAVFKVTVGADAPVGQHRSLFCQLTASKAGQPMVQTLAGGGVLRIDKPRVAVAPVVAPAPQPTPQAKPAAAPEPVRLSRLEQLRLEQAKQGQ